MYLMTVLVRRAGLIFSLAAGLGAVANAAIMNFETASPGSFLSAPFEEDGIHLSLIDGHYDVFDCASLGCPPANGFVAGLDAVNTGPSTVRIALLSGGLFNLDAIEILGPEPSSFMVASDGSFFSFDGTGGPFTGFGGIQYVDISSSVDIAGGFLFDNIAITPVPEPSTFLLLFLSSMVVLLFRERELIKCRLQKSSRRVLRFGPEQFAHNG